VIDFGIAKATEQRLTDKTLFTSYAQLMGTPAYMSPEQMELSGLNLDTRSDIYSLGVLLYELLTGRTPFDTTDLLKLGVEELRRTICEREPLSPSAKLKTLNNEELTKTARKLQVEAPRLVSQLRGDLDWIVLKCLEKDRTRRYATASGLAEDIQRYLQEEAVVARPPSQLYRLQKLVRRNRMVFLCGATAVIALLLGTIVSTSLFFSEARLRREAEAARREAEARESVRQAGLLMAQSQYEQADELLARIALEKPSLEIQTLLRTLGDWNAINSRWARAVERFESLVKLDPLDREGITLDHFRLGAALVESGRPDDYERLRQEIVSRFGSSTNPLADRLLKCCLMLPANEQLLQMLQPAADAAEKELAEPDQVGSAREPWTSSALALLEYRRGDDVKAKALCTRCLSSRGSNGPPGAIARVILALAYCRLHQNSQALAALSQGQEQIDLAFKNGLSLNLNNDLENWFDWVLARILMRECQEQLLATDRSHK